MKLTRRIRMMAGTLVLSAGLMAGSALAASTEVNTQPPTVATGRAVTELTQGEKDVLAQLKQLHRSYRDKARADAKALVEKAVKQGQITPEQGAKLLRFGHHKRMLNGKARNLSVQELKGKLDTAVQEGKLTQEHADRILQYHKERASQQ